VELQLQLQLQRVDFLCTEVLHVQSRMIGGHSSPGAWGSSEETGGVAATAQILDFVHLSHPARFYLVQHTVVRNRGGVPGTSLRGKGSPRAEAGP